MNKRLLSAIIFLTGIAVGFQNCSKTSFSANAPLSSYEVDGHLRELFSASTDSSFNKVDVLFVLDESVSMNTIIANVRSGFSSLASAQFPSDTMMAVTNMSPAYFTSPGVFDPARAYRTDSYVSKQPGFLRLVNKSSIASFKAAHPNESSGMTFEGCAQTWFAPLNRDAKGVFCLDGSTQTALQATGVEAGLVSLSQLAERTASSGGRLFRSGALVNIIFVSDTHDSGLASRGVEAYYGAAGAPAQLTTPSMLSSRLHTLNPGLAGVRFNAIVPLPPVGDARAAGLRIIGPSPANLSESKLSGEELHDFSYLPFVRASGGVAMHASSSDWKNAIAAMVEDLSKRINAVVNLTRPAREILSVKVNGTAIEASGYTLLSGQRIEIITQPSWPARVDIVVDYHPQ